MGSVTARVFLPAPPPMRSDPTSRSSAPLLRRIALPLAAALACQALGDAAQGQEEISVRASERWATDFTRHTVPLDEIVSGGPPKDGIPAIDDPRFESVEAADRWLSDRDPVAVVEREGEVKAYPLGILIRHEIVNDRVGDTPVSVTYCPLCNTTLAFDRRFDGRVLDFGTTGRLRHSDLIMYDRQTETWWQQATGEGIVGRYAGEELTFVPAPVLSWEAVTESYPGARVLSRDTGFPPRFTESYGSNPYVGYDRRRGPIESFFRGEVDDVLPRMERIVALGDDEASLAVPFRELRETRVAHVEVGDEEPVVFWAPGTASAVDASRIAESRDVGSTAVYRREVDGRRLTFEPAGDGRFTDRQTGSTWTLAGRAVEGPLEGRQLEPVAHGNHFWFAWAAFRPGTRVWRP